MYCECGGHLEETAAYYDGWYRVETEYHCPECGRVWADSYGAWEEVKGPSEMWMKEHPEEAEAWAYEAY